MMEKKNAYGIIAMLLLGSLAGGVQLTEEQYNNSWYCVDTDEVGIFNRLSSTQRTGYYVEDQKNRRAFCESRWISLASYVEAEGLNKDEFIKTLSQVTPEEPPQNIVCKEGQQCWECVPEGCVSR